MTRKTWVPAAAAVVVVVVAGGVVVTSSAERSSAAAQAPPANTVKVTKGRLAARVSQAGTLTFRARPDGSPYAVINRAHGVYTKLPDSGDKVGCGDVLYRVDDHPVLLLCGTVPAYRDLDRGDEGKDVRQLNRNLHELGYHADPDDSDFGPRTEEALERLQHDKRLDVTGTLALGAAVVLPGTARVSTVSGALGGSARPGAQVARATSATLVVRVDLDASQQGDVEKGDRARITLPGNTSVTGRVERLGSVTRSAGKDDLAAATIPAYISLDRPKRARGLDGAPVRVDITTTGVPSALSVPVVALVGRAGGGFAVEVVRDGGRRELVAVTLGLFDTAAGRVQVEGDLRAGDSVVVPSP